MRKFETEVYLYNYKDYFRQLIIHDKILDIEFYL